MRSSAKLEESVTVLLLSIASMVPALSAPATLPSILPAALASAHQATRTKTTTAFSDVESTRFSTTVNAAALLDTTQLMEFADSAIGIKYMIKVLESAEFLVTPSAFSISALKVVSAYLNIISFPTVLAELALSTLNIPQLLKPVSAMQDLSSTSDSALPPATPTNSGSTDRASARPDIT
jgi:hypothetical protein